MYRINLANSIVDKTSRVKEHKILLHYMSFFSNSNTISGRVHTSSTTKTRLQEATLRILEKEECERLGAYKNDKTNKTVKVEIGVELCAAKVTNMRSPERWIKVRSDPEVDKGKKKIEYEKGEDEKPSAQKSIHYGGLYQINLKIIS